MNLIQFQLKRDAEILGVGNGDPSSHEDDKWKLSLFNGKCQIILPSLEKEGEFVLTASSEGLKNATATIILKK
jgi:beta-galactosidase